MTGAMRARRGTERSSGTVDVVVPTVGRPSLGALLEALAGGAGPLPETIILVDDRRDRAGPLLPDGPPARLASRVRLVPGRAAGPAAARNAGWRSAGAEWVAFLDDDVVPDPDWPACLAEDLAGLGAEVAGSQGRLWVPLPKDRPPTDWERNAAGLQGALWITANIAYRRRVLEEVGGLDERFRRAFREDSDLGLRVTGAGYRIAAGRRRVAHPVRPAGRLVSVRAQAGNADDALMLARHGPRWRQAAGVSAGRRPLHLLTTAAATAGLLAFLAGRRGLGALGVLGWLVGTAELAWARIAPSPRTPDEVATMLLTSALLPAAATGYWIAGLVRWRGAVRRGAPSRGGWPPIATPEPGKTGPGVTPLPRSPGSGAGRAAASALGAQGP